MGLLDQFGSLADNPTMALAMGLLNASGPQSRPVSLGQAIGQGMQGMQEARQAHMRNALMALQAQHMQQQVQTDAEMKPLQVQQLKTAIAEHMANLEFANKLPGVLSSLTGGSPSSPTPYKDQVAPQQLGGSSFGGINGFKTPDEYFRMVAAIPDSNKADKLAAYEAGFRQWPETRPMVQSSQQAGTASPRDLGALGVMMASRGLKGGPEMMKLADMFKPEEFKGGSTYRMPDGTERYIPVLKEGQMPDGRGGMTAVPGFFDFQRQNTMATIDPVARARTRYETGIDPAADSSAQSTAIPGGLSPKDAAAVRVGATTGANDDWLKNSYRPVLDAGKSADNMLTSLAALRNTQMNTGWGTETKAYVASALEGLGIAPEKAKMYASNAQVFQSQASTRLWEVLNNAKGPQTEGDAERAKQTFAALKNTPRANEFIIDLAEAAARRDKLKSQFYAEAMPVARDAGDLTAVDRKWAQIQRSVWDDPIMAKWKTGK
jgi:hypothetical protein